MARITDGLTSKEKKPCDTCCYCTAISGTYYICDYLNKTGRIRPSKSRHECKKDGVYKKKSNDKKSKSKEVDISIEHEDVYINMTEEELNEFDKLQRIFE